MNHQLERAPHWVVLHDPDGEYWEGAVVDAAKARQLEARACVSMPCDPALFRLSGVGGFHKRAWGSGWPLDMGTPGYAAPLTVYATPEQSTFHWRLRLAADQGVLERLAESHNKLTGFLRFVPDNSQANAQKLIAVDNAVIQGEALSVPDADGGWTLGGAVRLSITQPGHYGFGFYGMMPGARVLWGAVSATAG